MLNRLKCGFTNAMSSVRALRKNDEGIVMVEWVALAGIFVVILVVTFLAIGEKADTIVTAVDNQLEQITSNIGTGGATP